MKFEHADWCLSVQPIHEDGPCNCGQVPAPPPFPGGEGGQIEWHDHSNARAVPRADRDAMVARALEEMRADTGIRRYCAWTGDCFIYVGMNEDESYEIFDLVPLRSADIPADALPLRSIAATGEKTDE